MRERHHLVERKRDDSSAQLKWWKMWIVGRDKREIKRNKATQIGL